MQENEFIAKMIEQTTNEQEIKFLNQRLDDNKVPIVGSYDTHDICSKQNFTVEKIKLYLERLEEAGFQAARSVFPITGIKTNANFEELKKTFKK